MRIEVKKKVDEYTNECWAFNMFDLDAVFVLWYRENKPKGKRKWRIVEFWDKYGRRGPSEPKLPGEIRAEALKEITQYIKVKTWKEWEGGNLLKKTKDNHGKL